MTHTHEIFQNIYTNISQSSQQEVQKAESFFQAEYCKKLSHKSTYVSSIIARYLISKIAEQKFGIQNFLPQIDNSGKPIFETDIFWSIAHSGNTIFVWVTKGIPIGVDIEQVLPRDTSLFKKFTDSEWLLFGEKNWENFYTIWTAKEAVIKLNRGKLDDISNYHFTEIFQKKISIDNQEFTTQLSLFWHPFISIYSHIMNETRYTLALERGK